MDFITHGIPGRTLLALAGEDRGSHRRSSDGTRSAAWCGSIPGTPARTPTTQTMRPPHSSTAGSRKRLRIVARGLCFHSLLSLNIRVPYHIMYWVATGSYQGKTRPVSPGSRNALATSPSPSLVQMNHGIEECGRYTSYWKAFLSCILLKMHCAYKKQLSLDKDIFTLCSKFNAERHHVHCAVSEIVKTNLIISMQASTVLRSLLH